MLFAPLDAAAVWYSLGRSSGPRPPPDAAAEDRPQAVRTARVLPAPSPLWPAFLQRDLSSQPFRATAAAAAGRFAKARLGALSLHCVAISLPCAPSPGR